MDISSGALMVSTFQSFHQSNGPDFLKTSTIENNNNNDRIEDVRTYKQNSNNLLFTPKLRPYEKAFLPSHLDPSITVGYRYKVRKNGSNEFMFSGKPLCLKAIHQDNCTELLFEKQNILKNYSTHNNARFGFALSISVLELDMSFKVYDEDENIGVCTVLSVSGDQQIVLSQKGTAPNFIDFKEIQVNFKCQFNIHNKTFDSDVAGVIMTIKRPNEEAKIKSIEALVLPFGKMFKLIP